MLPASSLFQSLPLSNSKMPKLELSLENTKLAVYIQKKKGNEGDGRIEQRKEGLLKKARSDRDMCT